MIKKIPLFLLLLSCFTVLHAQSEFITTWETTSDNESITIPTTGDGYDYTVVWGDGTTTPANTGDATHIYATAGTYDVAITGDFPRIYFNNRGDRLKIKRIKQWGSQEWSSMVSAFRGCANLEGEAIDTPNLSKVESMRRMFDFAVRFNDDIGDWDVSNVKSMMEMFSNTLRFNGNIGAWKEKVGHVTNMNSMFRNARGFNQDLGEWDVSKVTDMDDMFQSAIMFDQNLSDWDVSSVTTMTGMFYLTELSVDNYEALLKGWSNRSLQSYVSFYGGESVYCSEEAELARQKLINDFNWDIYDNGKDCPFTTTWETTTANEPITIPTAAGSNYDYTISWGDGNTEKDISGNITHTYDMAGIHTIRITGDFPRIYFNNSGDKRKIQSIEHWSDQIWESMENAFYGCENLQVNDTEAPVLSGVRSMEGMFDGAIRFNANIGNWDVSRVGSMKNMFRGATNFNGNIGDWNSNISEVTDMEGMFDGATSFDQDISGWDVSKVENMKNMFRGATNFNGSLLVWARKVSYVEDMEGMFDGAENYNQSMRNWSVGNVTTMKNMFRGALAFNGNLEGWNTRVSHVEDMEGMFDGAVGFNHDLAGWNVTRVETMKNMFRGATSFNGNIDNWRFSFSPNITDMEGMFDGATSFSQDIGAWNVSKVTTMRNMFRGATSFNGNIGNWSFSFSPNITDMEGMFDGATSFSQDIGAWNVSEVTTMRNMFRGVTLSRGHYEALLKGWSNRRVFQNGVFFHGGNSVYCSDEVENLRKDLVDTYGWTITDGGKDCNLSTQDIAMEDFVIHPIPTNGSITIDIDANIEQLTLYTLQGAQVQSKKQKGNKEMDLSGLSSGTYILKVQTDKGTVIKRIVKQ